MRKITLILVIIISAQCSFSQSNDKISFSTAKFHTGDEHAWASPKFNDIQWLNISTLKNWESQSYKDYDGFAWYRMHIIIPSSLRQHAYLKDSLRINLGKIDDAAEIFLNGTLIGKTGSFPTDKDGYVSAYYQIAEFHVPTNAAFLNWDKENIIAVRVYDGSGAGGMYGPSSFINMMDIIDGISIGNDESPFKFLKDNTVSKKFSINNHSDQQISGIVDAKVTELKTSKVVYKFKKAITLQREESKKLDVNFTSKDGLALSYHFTENKTKKSIEKKSNVPYILTPAVAAYPKINGASVFGVRPGSPFLFRIPATGIAPMQFKVIDLPKELNVDELTGIITGSIKDRGDYKMQLIVKNNLGEAKKYFTVKVGDLLALTPPMGWNSWNCWGLSVSDAKVKSSAGALISKGLINHGWCYINIDDGWEAEKRADNGTIVANNKFPDMKALTDYLHAEGLKAGIYSSPGDRTCGGFLGSLHHEAQDAETYAGWGIDYLKYDLCSYEEVMSKNPTLDEYKKPYQIMQDALSSQFRDIVYSLCEYGLKDVWKWGGDVNGNLWRTTGDINDSWQSLSGIGFQQDVSAPYASPGRWNDPDMLTIGRVGWGENLHETHLTPDEQYTHISLWSMLSAPLLLGCDLSQLDDFTLNLITNDEVIAVDQDPLGKAAHKAIANKDYQVWVKDLEDGTKAIGIFNLSEAYSTITIDLNVLTGNNNNFSVRDLWRQKDLGNFKNRFTGKVPSHGVLLIRVKNS